MNVFFFCFSWKMNVCTQPKLREAIVNEQNTRVYSGGAVTHAYFTCYIWTLNLGQANWIAI